MDKDAVVKFEPARVPTPPSWNPFVTVISVVTASSVGFKVLNILFYLMLRCLLLRLP